MDTCGLVNACNEEICNFTNTKLSKYGTCNYDGV